MHLTKHAFYGHRLNEVTEMFCRPKQHMRSAFPKQWQPMAASLVREALACRNSVMSRSAPASAGVGFLTFGTLCFLTLVAAARLLGDMSLLSPAESWKPFAAIVDRCSVLEEFEICCPASEQVEMASLENFQ